MHFSTAFLAAFTALCGSLVAGNLCTEYEFQQAVTSNGYEKPSSEQYRNLVNRANNGRITTKRELAMFLANIIHESAGLTTKEEWGPPPPGTYVGPLDKPGKLYHGRGYIQLTWAYNYLAASLALYDDHRLLDDPDQVKTDDGIAWDVSFWFWSANVHDKSGVQNGNFGATILAINGGLECGQWASNPSAARKRIDYYKNVLQAFNIFGGDIYCTNACDCVIPTNDGSDGGSDSGCSKSYTVWSGDSFWQIATDNDMSVDQLQALNPSVSNPSSIYPGQVLCIRR